MGLFGFGRKKGPEQAPKQEPMVDDTKAKAAQAQAEAFDDQVWSRQTKASSGAEMLGESATKQELEKQALQQEFTRRMASELNVPDNQVMLMLSDENQWALNQIKTREELNTFVERMVQELDTLPEQEAAKEAAEQEAA